MDLSSNNMDGSTPIESNKHFLLSVAILEESLSKSENESKTKHIEDSVKSVLLAQEMLSERVFLLEKSIEDKNEEMQLFREFLSNSRIAVKNDATTESHVKSYTIELSKILNIPGFRVLKNARGNGVHTFLWIIIYLIALFISYSYIKDAYVTWQESPIIHSSKNTLTETGDIPFPAVTICFPNTINRNYNLMENVDKCFKCDTNNYSVNWACEVGTGCSDIDMITLRFSFTLCDSDIWYDQDSSRYVAMKEYFERREFLEGEQFHKVLKRLLPECEANGMKLYDTKSEYNTCNPVFKPMLIKQSRNYFCTTYNGLAIDEIFRVNVIPPISQTLTRVSDQLPTSDQWRADNMLGYGRMGLQTPDYNPEPRIIVFKSQKTNLEEMCSPGIENDYKIALHTPGEIPMIENTNFYSYKVGSNVEMRLRPILTSAHKSIEQHTPNQRGCYFSNEKELTLFKYYTEKNCLLECKMNCSIKLCGCVPFYLPRINNSVNVCLDFPIEGSCETKYLNEFPKSCECACLPDCNSLSYDYETQAVGPTVYGDEPKIIIQYEAPQFTSYVRFSVIDRGQFIAYTFVFLLMFNEISVIFFIEVIYLMIYQLWNWVQTRYI